MGAVNKLAWEKKLRSWVPAWLFERGHNAEATFAALAAAFADLEDELLDHVSQTFITTATDDTLDLLGSERGVSRQVGERDQAFAPRVQQIINQGNLPGIKAIVDAILQNGQSIIVEDADASLFASRESFTNRNAILLSSTIKDAFSILVPQQLHAPYSYVGQAYAGSDYAGRLTSSDEVFQSVWAAVNDARLGGALFRIIETLGA